ncbi:MAG TPA: glycosyltransferase family 87 protein [Gemmatimonadales bacterium]|nr:glycosyltransferase family 87 protein [Gemmatimonadales bacterium]
MVGALLLIVVLVVAATTRAQKQGIGTDFHVFWQAGRNFLQGAPLYHPEAGARRYTYPPFAAQLFQILGVLPLQTAALLFYLGSVGLFAWAVLLCRRIIRQLEPTWRQGNLPLVLALLCSAVFALDNMVHLQVNILTFTLCLLGAQAFIRRRDGAAGFWLVGATAIKITPVFFLVWTVIRGTRRTILAVTGFGALAVLLPIAQRGSVRGTADLVEYYRSFLHQFASGGVVTVFRNQNLAAMVYRALVPGASRDAPPYDYAYLPFSPGAASYVYRVGALLIVSVFIWYLIRGRVTHRPIGALEISSVFLVSHLLSGVTWKAHVVSLLFVSYVFFSLDPGSLTHWRRWTLLTAWAGLFTIGLGRDLIGSTAHHYMAGYSVYVWVMLGLLTLSLVWSNNHPLTGTDMSVTGDPKPATE